MSTAARAHVVQVDGSSFTTSIANLTTLSVFLKATKGLRFCEKIALSFFDITTVGHVVYLAPEPPHGAVVLFVVPRPVREKLVTRSKEVDVISPDPPAFIQDACAGPKSAVGAAPQPDLDLPLLEAATIRDEAITVHGRSARRSSISRPPARSGSTSAPDLPGARARRP